MARSPYKMVLHSRQQNSAEIDMALAPVWVNLTARNWALGMKGVAGYEPIAVPYPGGNLPGFRLQARGKERSTFVFTGGYDSFVAEFYNFLLPLAELGFTVIAFDGPGQGGALRQGIYLDHAWEKPPKAVIDYFELDSVDWLGAS